MPDGAVIRWLFGKMPAHGDFISRGMDAMTRDAFDTWLSAEMARARTVWGDEFDVRYDTAPVWHFVDEGSGTEWRGGVLCCSADRVGRRYPLLIAAPAADRAGAVAVSAGCLAMLGRAFADGWDVERLCAERVSPEDLPWQPHGAAWALVGEDGPVIEEEGSCPAGVIERMLEMAA